MIFQGTCIFSSNLEALAKVPCVTGLPPLPPPSFLCSSCLSSMIHLGCLSLTMESCSVGREPILAQLGLIFSCTLQIMRERKGEGGKKKKGEREGRRDWERLRVLGSSGLDSVWLYPLSLSPLSFILKPVFLTILIFHKQEMTSFL